ncbi:MAG: hypothetical protein ACYDC3_11260 [Candidatus Binataceae bacterium]
MRFTYAFASVWCALLLASANAIAQGVPLRKTHSNIDEHGCLNFEATALVEAQIEDLFDALSRPELLWAQTGGGGILLGDYVDIPLTHESLLENRWVMIAPEAKILEFGGMQGASVPNQELPRSWVEYRFVRPTHTITEHEIGSTFGWEAGPPRPDVKFVLSAAKGNSETSVSYSSKQCWPAQNAEMSAARKLAWVDSDKQSAGNWLTAAEFEAQRISEERLKSGAKATSTPPPANPCATPTPVVAPEGR